MKVNFDTNGYMTEKSLERILALTTSITFDLKAFGEELTCALTGAPSQPVRRNAQFIGRHAKDQLWEYRILVIPFINQDEILKLTDFIAEIDPSLPVCFLAFRPNFVLENHPGATQTLMEECVACAQQSGLENAYWSGHTGPPGTMSDSSAAVSAGYGSKGSQVAGTYALTAGCRTQPRHCSSCLSSQECEVKRFVPERLT